MRLTKPRWDVLLAALLACCVVPSLLHAHPKLRKSVPASGETLRGSPPAITLEFSQPVELAMSRIEITNEDNVGFAVSRVAHGADRSTLFATTLNALGPGEYKLSWRTAGPDGHPITGGYSFTVVEASDTLASVDSGASQSGQTTESDLSEGPRVSSPQYVLARTLGFAALITVIGALVFRYGVLARARIPADIRARLEARSASIGLAAAAILVVAAMVRLYLQGKLLDASGPATAGGMWPLLTSTQWGQAWMIQMATALIAFGALVWARRGKHRGWTLGMATIPFLAAGTGLGGHAGASAQPAVAMAADTFHVIGAGGWLGALACLLIAVIAPAIRNRDENGWGTAASVVNTFSPMALFFAALVAITGLVSSWLRVGTLSNLFATDYGNALLRKLVVVSLLLVTGAYNYLRVRPTLGTSAATTRLSRSSTVELLVGFLVVVLTAVLVATDPPVQ